MLLQSDMHLVHVRQTVTNPVYNSRGGGITTFDMNITVDSTIG